MDEQPRRRSLTPIGDELTPHETVPGKASLLDRWRRRRARKQPPATLAGAVVAVVVRLLVTAVVASAVAVVLARLSHRPPSFGLYIVGVVVMASAIAASTGRGSLIRERYAEHALSRRMAASAASGVAGLVVLALGALVESLGH